MKKLINIKCKMKQEKKMKKKQNKFLNKIQL